MKRNLLLWAALAATFAAAACADSTAPKNDCPIYTNPATCTPS